uniref:hypothetical protein n=1 Tax=Vibrio cholerae TaxID=666 RepID=UPI001E2F4F7E
VCASPVEVFKDPRFSAGAIRSQKRLNAETVAARRLAEKLFQRHIDAGGSDFLIKGGFPDKPVAH